LVWHLKVTTTIHARAFPKLKKQLEVEADLVLCHDPYIQDARFVSLSEIKEKADIVVVATPHSIYAEEDWGNKEVVDMWNFYGNGGLV